MAPVTVTVDVIVSVLVSVLSTREVVVPLYASNKGADGVSVIVE